jgi:hypothetical protein
VSDIIISIFHYFDPNCTRVLTFDQFWDKLNMKPNNNNNNSNNNNSTKSDSSIIKSSDSSMSFNLIFIDKVLEIKEEERVFIRQMRTNRNNSNNKGVNSY